jgi:hypothetical protein
LRLQVLIPLWKRPQVTKFCFDGLQTLIKESQHEIKVMCVISEPEYIEVCEGYGFEWVAAPNNPVGEKINSGARRVLMNKDWDYLMMMNSDNVIKAELINEVYKPFFESLKPFFGISKVTYVNFGTDEAREIEYDFSVLGIGKCIRRDVVEKSFKMLGYLYTPDRNRGLDDSMMDNLISIGTYPTMARYTGQLAMDFKSEVNIWPWETFKDKGTVVCYKAG